MSASSSTGAPEQTKIMLTDLADILRNAGLMVVEVDAGPPTGDYPSLPTVRDGRPDLAGPLAQLGLGRTGTWYVIAAGLSYHAGVTIDPTLFSNQYAIGVEAEGTGVPPTDTGHAFWPEVQWQSYVRGVRVLQTAYSVPTARVLGHKEVAFPAGRKVDPNFLWMNFVLRSIKNDMIEQLLFFAF